MKTNCDIIRDLLPLYAEHITSEATNALVEEHLAECEACRAELEQMEQPVLLLSLNSVWKVITGRSAQTKVLLGWM